MFTFKACCKINLGLLVTERRPDGYHNLQTVFYPVPLSDEISVEEAREDSLTMSGIPIEGASEDNLVHIHLHKNIPNGAGLGGGSSDAAGIVRELNNHYTLGLNDQKMEEMVATLGADCPFFVRCKPVYAEGIGNIFSPINLNLSGMHIVLIKPDDFVSTREAYAQIHPQMPEVSLDKLVMAPLEEWRNTVGNDFEHSVFPAHPAIKAIKDQLYAAGAIYSSMSGSGSSVFGLFAEKPSLEGRFGGMFVYESRL